MDTQKIMDLKWKLLTEFGTTEGVPFCKDAFAFIVNGLQETAAKTPVIPGFTAPATEAFLKKLNEASVNNSEILTVGFKDGVYIIYEDGSIDGSIKPFKTSLSKQNAKNVAFKFGPVSLIVCPYDIEDVTMECEDNSEPESGYVTRYSEAVAAYNGNVLTDGLVKRGLNFADKIPDKYFIPSLGELYVMYAMKNRINEALEWIGQETIKDYCCYWSSTESSAYGAWGLFFDGGGFNYYGKAGTFRVRPVSAFVIPSTL